jgi:hypothetical protein
LVVDAETAGAVADRVVALVVDAETAGAVAALGAAGTSSSGGAAMTETQKVQYEGTVWAIDHKYPQPLVDHALHKLEQHGIDRSDIVITDAPSDVKVGAIVVEIWPYHLDVARVRTVRNESFISGTILTIELKLDDDGNYTD